MIPSIVVKFNLTTEFDLDTLMFKLVTRFFQSDVNLKEENEINLSKMTSDNIALVGDDTGLPLLMHARYSNF